MKSAKDSITDKNELLKLYETMLLIRKSELATQKNYKKGEVGLLKKSLIFHTKK